MTKRHQGRNGHGSSNGTRAKHRGRTVNVKPVNGLTKQHVGGPAAHKEAVQRAKELALITERQLQAWNLFTAGATFEQIGAELGISNCMAHKDCMAVKKAMPQVLAHDGVELLKARVLQRTDAIIRRHWPSLKEKASADVILKAMEREAKVVGYDAQREDGFSAEQVAALLRSVRADMLDVITDPAVRQAIGQILQRRAGLLAGQTIETTAVKETTPG